MAGMWMPSDPHLHRWMLFVDGENLAIRAKQLADNSGIELTNGPYYKPDVFAWFPGRDARQRILEPEGKPPRLQTEGVRSYYYTSATGDEDVITSIRKLLWNAGFQPVVFKKPRNRSKSKGVDITLAKDLLSHAFHDNYDVAILVAGDGDYVPLLEEVKRLGKIVYVAFFQGEGLGLSPELFISSDVFWPIDELFVYLWNQHQTQDES